jgi:hypothetical protein
MALGFQVSVGSIPGRAHVGSGNLLNGKNNQDGFVLEVFDDCIIALVQDGCSSGAHSEVGAKVGAKILSRLIYDSIRSGALPAVATADDASLQLERIRRRLLSRLKLIAESLKMPNCICPNQSKCKCGEKKLVHDFLLFTTVGLIVMPSRTIIFSLGDGMYALNDRIEELGPFPNNAPPYVAYSLFPNLFAVNQELLRYKIHAVIPTQQLNSAMVATDGLKELVGRELRTFPGKQKCIGNLRQLWLDDRFFEDEDQTVEKGDHSLGNGNRELITPWLRQINSEVVRLNTDEFRMERSAGLLQDDTTVIALRRQARGR